MSEHTWHLTTREGKPQDLLDGSESIVIVESNGPMTIYIATICASRHFAQKLARAKFIVRACTAFADVEEGISLIARKDHYYQLEAQAKSQPDLLAACKELIEQEPYGVTPYFDAALRQVEAAIEKATA